MPLIRRKRRRTALDPLLSLCKDSESSETIEAATSGPIETGSESVNREPSELPASSPARSSPSPRVSKRKRIESSPAEEDSEKLPVMTVEAFLQHQTDQKPSSKKRGKNLAVVNLMGGTVNAGGGSNDLETKKRKRKEEVSATRSTLETPKTSGLEPLELEPVYRGDPLSLKARRPEASGPEVKKKETRRLKALHAFPKPAFSHPNKASQPSSTSQRQPQALHLLAPPPLPPSQVSSTPTGPKLELVPCSSSSFVTSTTSQPRRSDKKHDIKGKDVKRFASSSKSKQPVSKLSHKVPVKKVHKNNSTVSIPRTTGLELGMSSPTVETTPPKERAMPDWTILDVEFAQQTQSQYELGPADPLVAPPSLSTLASRPPNDDSQSKRPLQSLSSLCNSLLESLASLPETDQMSLGLERRRPRMRDTKLHTYFGAEPKVPTPPPTDETRPQAVSDVVGAILVPSSSQN